MTPIVELYYNENSVYGVYKFYTQQSSLLATKQTESYDFETNETKIKFEGMLAGRTQKLTLGTEYEIKAKLEFSKKYKNYNYVPVNVTQPMPKSIDEQRKFLQSVCTTLQANILLEQYPNVVQMIVDGKENEIDLNKTKGIKEITFENIKNKVLDNYAISDVLALLAPLGISFSKIKKLLGGEPNPTILKEKILDDPYILNDIDGISFRVVDKIAVGMNPEFLISKKRLISFIKNYLKEIGENDGHTWVYFKEIENNVRDNIIECIDLLDEVIEEQKEYETFLHIDNQGSEDKEIWLIGSKYYYDVELKIWNLINQFNNSMPLEINDEDIENGIRISEEEQGFEFLPQQKELLYNMTKNNLNIITGKSGCVDKDTEFFTGKQWKKISEYKNNDMVLQYNRDGSANLVYPQNYIKEECNWMWHFKTKYGLDQCLSEEHNVYYITSKGNLYHKTMKEVIENHNENGFIGKFITSFKYNGSGIKYNNNIIRLIVAAIADGSFYYHITNINTECFYTCRFHVKKDRKKERLIFLFNECNLDYRAKESAAKGYIDYYVQMPERIKKFDERWYNCTNEQLKIICNELIYWDGDFNKKNNISTTIKENADFIQFAFSSCGYKSTINTCDRSGRKRILNNKEYITKSIDYNINFTNRNLISLCKDKRSGHTITPIDKYKTLDGYKYCFTVPSGMLVLRRNNKIFITGNCGKTTLTRGLISIYKQKYSIGACALSSKAATRLQEVTGQPAMTIHRLLSAKGLNIFEYNEYMKLPYDILICDELSMVYSGLFYHLISAVKDGAKIILVGDGAQLNPLSWGNLLVDLLEKKNLQINYLTKIMRQALDSAIVTDANLLRDGIDPLNGIKTFKEIRGVKKDFIYMFRSDKNDIFDIAVKTYLKSVEEVGLDNVYLITPRRDNADLSTKTLNKKIQDLLLDDTLPYVLYGKDIKYKLGAKIIHRKNNYDLGIMNGEQGYVIEILNINNENEGDGLIAKYGDKIIEYDKSNLKELNLAYSITVHLSQGSEADTVIIALDSSSYTLLNNCLVYTAVTRAKSRCLLLSQPYSYDKCVKTNVGNYRNTWTQFFS
jgi:hypothetical protein